MRQAALAMMLATATATLAGPLGWQAPLASVLAVFPHTASIELVRLAKARAVPEPGLVGFGRADFTCCMTVMGETGQWCVVGVDDVISPMAMQRMQSPGRACMRAAFANDARHEVTQP